ncbi:hypothetical protein H4219_001742 [Mycoemilia scoparia]|uniref:Uncharacterized protein n=1 Tax=Mycoemilia scoparia TaxID=417184 RepID=A0A9W8DV03_9FUNG|nr:hypothetical protein H4219_001742 [Mycoemilia scoparia]
MTGESMPNDKKQNAGDINLDEESLKLLLNQIQEEAERAEKAQKDVLNDADSTGLVTEANRDMEKVGNVMTSLESKLDTMLDRLKDILQAQESKAGASVSTSAEKDETSQKDKAPESSEK